MRDNDSLILENLYEKIVSEKYHETYDIDPEILKYAESKGYSIEAFHGSHERYLTKISKMKTSYGLFFSPDPITSSGYAGNDGKLYHVLLQKPDNSKVLDLTDEFTKDSFFKKHFSSGNLILKSKEENFYGNFDVLSNDAIVKIIIKKAENDEEFESFLIQNLNLNEDSTIDDIEFELDYSDKLFELLKFENVFELFSNKYEVYDEELNDIHNLYKTNMQDFYMQYQDDVLKSAQHDSFEFVIFDDPATSAGGESISYVVFDSSHIKLADEETRDDQGNTIPLSQRFDSSNDDIRY